MSPRWDLALHGGTVLDGTGAAAVRADVAVAGGRVAAVGVLSPGERASAAASLDVAGLVVTPGFIDVHSHSDAYLLVEPDAPSKVRQGVTTEIVGQCGCSAAPLLDGARHPSDWQAVLAGAGIDPETPGGACWRSVAAYRARLAEVGHAPNVMLLAGHNTLRAGVMGYAARPARADECARMAGRLEQALEEGASGLSTGLIYQPGCHSEPAEVDQLAGVVARHGGLYATHLRSEGDRLLEALDEALAVTRRHGLRTQVSHLKTSGRANWHKLDAALAAIEAARRDGLPVHADRYPYLAGGTDLDVVLPGWAACGGREAVLARLGDAAEAPRIAAEMAASRPAEAWDGVVIGATWHADTRPFRGVAVSGVARRLGCSPAEAVLHVLRRDELRTGAFFFGLSEANLRRIYEQPWVMVGSDASLRATVGPLADDHPHPRSYGAFPRFLRASLDGEGPALPEAVRRMTSLPADAFGLAGRGRLVPGAWADAVVFDPRALRDTATYAAPHQYAEGIRCTLVNGRVAFDGSRAVARPGRWLTACR